jgi:putative spermidine/putrescine transport system substrate-binding protein
MKLTQFILPSALAMLPVTGAMAQDATLPPCDNCSDTLTISSWGGAYQDMQTKLFAEPYIAATGVKIIWEESSAEAVAKLRAMSEAGNVTWDVADVLASDGIRLCDEGLVQEVPLDEWLSPAPDGTPASKDLEKSVPRPATSRPMPIRRPSPTAPTSPNGTARCRPRSATSSTSRPSPASARWKSAR